MGRPLIAALLFLGIPIAWLYQASAAFPAVRAAVGCSLRAASPKWGFSRWRNRACCSSASATARRGCSITGPPRGRSPHWRRPSSRKPLGCGRLYRGVGSGARRRLAPAAAAHAERPWRRRPDGVATAAGSLAIISWGVPLLLGRSRRRPPIPWTAHRASSCASPCARAPGGPALQSVPHRALDRIPPLLQFAVGPDPRPDRTPVPLLYNARWSLRRGTIASRRRPRVDRQLHGTLSLQVDAPARRCRPRSSRLSAGGPKSSSSPSTRAS